jgi:anti-sigma B factor antagonist
MFNVDRVRSGLSPLVEHAAKEAAVALDNLLDEASAGRLHIFVNEQLGQTHLMLMGELDLATTPDLAQRLRDIGADCDVVIDISMLDFIDSCGLSVFVAAHQRLRSRGRRLTICSPTPSSRRAFQIPALDTVLSIEPETRQSAVESWRFDG